jgi:hypothetical protein
MNRAVRPDVSHLEYTSQMEGVYVSVEDPEKLFSNIIDNDYVDHYANEEDRKSIAEYGELSYGPLADEDYKSVKNTIIRKLIDGKLDIDDKLVEKYTEHQDRESITWHGELAYGPLDPKDRATYDEIKQSIKNNINHYYELGTGEQKIGSTQRFYDKTTESEISIDEALRRDEEREKILSKPYKPGVQITLSTQRPSFLRDTEIPWPVGYGLNYEGVFDPSLKLYAPNGLELSDPNLRKEVAQFINQQNFDMPDKKYIDLGDGEYNQSFHLVKLWRSICQRKFIEKTTSGCSPNISKRTTQN